ncbi:hypothetical protein [Komagataeibacter oboediens]|uniref:Uncharacterized protein n=1 Tax=Komagataeibacter oboediens TaxID=65958 RepID=A0ABS5SJ16_9PROT|nr:hypothetical protein [Komagataeibacter oboediens]MBT0674234.1 hypothetical protein [Komagataeibacter oboediens]MBT0679395.1 hypothetical protein [Komagataeibacter oboediens]
MPPFKNKGGIWKIISENNVLIKECPEFPGVAFFKRQRSSKLFEKSFTKKLSAGF